MKNTSLFLLLLVVVSLSSCWWLAGGKPPVPYHKVWGYKPIFSEDPELFKVKIEPAREMVNPGKIYVKGNLIYQADVGAGIHIIDKTVPGNLVNKGFIRVIGTSDMSIKDDYMYVNAVADLVVVDISDWENVKEIKRISNAFNAGRDANAFQPMVALPERGVYYDCTELYVTGRVQIGWERDSVYNYCFYE